MRGPKKSPEELLDDVRRLKELGYCAGETSSPVYSGFGERRRKRTSTLNIADLWGKRMTHQVIRESGYWEAYRLLRTQGPEKAGIDLNLHSSPHKTDEEARRRLIYQKSQRKATARLAKETVMTLKTKKAIACKVVGPQNSKMHKQVTQLILDCDSLQEATGHLQAILTPPSNLDGKRLPKLSCSEQRLFNRLVSQL
jgi:hypothetical protein